MVLIATTTTTMCNNHHKTSMNWIRTKWDRFSYSSSVWIACNRFFRSHSKAPISMKFLLSTYVRIKFEFSIEFYTSFQILSKWMLFASIGVSLNHFHIMKLPTHKLGINIVDTRKFDKIFYEISNKWQHTHTHIPQMNIFSRKIILKNQITI